MFITRLDLQNFRNFESFSGSFGPGINCIWGNNGAGKSNLLEAIYFAATGRPKRAGRDGELVRFGAAVARVEARVQEGQGEHVLEAALEMEESMKTRKILKLNHQLIRRLSELVGQVKVVLFTPADEAVVQGEPSFRRRFLDLALSQMFPRYLHDLQQYQGVREQRNSLLKRPHSKAELTPWNEELLEYGSRILLVRLQILPELSLAAGAAYQGLSGGTALDLLYHSTIGISHENSLDAIRDAFNKALDVNQIEEENRRMTLVGPHRDDFSIRFDGVDARLFGSQGEQKTAALALVLGEAKLFTGISGEPPIHLLDDCFSELDPKRQEAVIKILDPGSQVILTFSSAPPALLDGAPTIELSVNRGEPVSSR